MDYFNHILTGTALLSAFSFLTYQLRDVPTLIIRLIKRKLVYSLVIDETTDIYEAFTKWLNERYSEKIMSEKVSSRYLGKVSYQPNDFRLLIKYKSRYILVDAFTEKLDNANSKNTRYFYKYQLTSLFGKSVIQSIILEVNEILEKEREECNYIYRWTGDYWVSIKRNKKKKNVFLENKEEITKDIERFFNSEEWYYKRHIPYKRGYIFYGEPGNGKTSFVQELGYMFKKDIYYLNIGSFSENGQLMSAINHSETNGIFLLEDADSLIPKRSEENKIETKLGVSFDTLLNVLDGILSKEGSIFIMTTNHIEIFDPAVIREGRVDVKVKFENPKKEIVEQYISNFYERELSLKSYNKTHSMAKIQELCLINKDNPSKLISILEE